jgi:GT2 family glycosyltransferase
LNPLQLVPSRDVEARDGRFFALTNSPWLEVPTHPALRGGRFVEIVYRLGFWDEPVRPVFRFIGPSGIIADVVGAGPVAGVAHWIGRVPAGTTRIEVSPTCRPGPFDFTIESVRRRRLPVLLAQALRQAPRQTRSTVLTRIIGWRPEAEVNFCWAIGFTPLAHYSRWRAPDLTNLDRPRFDWAEGPSFDIILAGANGLGRSLASLSAQLYPRRRVRFAPMQPTNGESLIELDDRAASGEPSRFILALNGGQVLQPEALAVVAEMAVRYPDTQLLYADEEDGGADRPPRPLFKPGWSPTLFAGRPHLGRAVFVRGDLWERFTKAEKVQFVIDAMLPAALNLSPNAARAIPRVLLTGAPDRQVSTQAARPISVAEGTRATIVIPTRDRAALLSRCVASLRAGANRTAFEIVIVDNGSVEAETAALFRELSTDSKVRVLSRPGAFNYAALCNDAAATSDADLLVFLNNDTAVRTPDWLDRLAHHALVPEVGAVGAKLLLPDGRVQHVGVVLGLGGLAGHFGASAPGDAAGWANRHEVAHDIAAVTGACLAVERQKFEAVGGFDAVNLPIELNDIDLCLRLSAQGWRARVDPSVRLLHEESASRGGATFRRLNVYADQRACFAERWQGAVRDDPYFHPGLSLFNIAPALG